MAGLEEPLYTYLSDTLSVTTRVYPKRAPEGSVLPYVTFERVSAQRTYTHDPFDETLAWVRARVSLACVSTSMLASVELAEELVAALSGYQGEMEGLNVGKCDVINELDLYDPQTKVYRRVVDVLIDYEEVLLASS